jgi:hypothetical protein
VHRHGHPLVMIVDAADELGQVRLNVAQRKHCHSQKYDQKSGDRQTALSLPWCTNPFTNYMPEAGSLFENRPLTLVAGAGFEPATSGL